MTATVDTSKPFVAVDGWEYASIGDFMLGERMGDAFSLHNAMREASEALKNFTGLKGWKGWVASESGVAVHVFNGGHRDPEEYL